MAQEVYVILMNIQAFDGSAGASPYNVTNETELRCVFDSLEKAQRYCEDSNHYLDTIGDWYFDDDYAPCWDDTGKVYTIVDHKDHKYAEDYVCIFFSIETRNIQ